MNTFTSPFERPFMSDLKRERESRINYLINNLKIDDVKDDKVFANKTLNIRDFISSCNFWRTKIY